MLDKPPPILIQTKLHQPSLPVDMVLRPRLTTWLEQRRGRPLTLISAPAGYGKSTLISCWLETVDCPTAWVSLDERDNQLGSFLGYFLAAVENIFPNAVEETQSFLLAASQPSISAIANTLINELNQIEPPFILVLDDYHLIETQAIHDLLNDLLLYPPENLHLVLGTRMDPLLPLATLRANNQMTEVRIPDLRFNQEETRLLFQSMLGASIDANLVSEMDVQAEGWVTGLRLAALAMQNRIGRNSFPGKLSSSNQYVAEYLVAEILAKQAVTISDCMLKTSILERFSADLCEVVCSPRKEPSGNEPMQSDYVKSGDFKGERFMEWLQASNLFVIRLDDQHEWYRYHHLFREFLQQELVRKFGEEEIQQLHALAGDWYAQNGWVDEALYHLMEANETHAAIVLVARHRYQMMNETQWPRLESLLNQFPPEVVETSAELWMLKTWLVYHRGQWPQLPALLQHLAGIMTQQPEQETGNSLAGEISSLRGLVAYHHGDIEGTISHTRQALELTPPELWIVRVFARIYLGGGLLLKGDISAGYQAFYSAFDKEEVQSKPFKGAVLMGACYFHWITGDLKGMEQAAKQAIVLCQASDFHQILGQSHYHLGCIRYQQNDLAAAEQLFAWVVERPYQNYGTCYVSSVCGLAMTYLAQEKETEAHEIVETAIAFLLETGNTSMLPIILALQAEVALRQGRLPAASQWADKLDPVLQPMPWFLSPHLTLIRVWLAQNTPLNQAKATGLLSQLEAYLASIHNTRFLIETLALQALSAAATGDHPAAMVALEKSLRLAQPGGFIRVFVDLGSQMAHLLSRLKVEKGLQAYAGQIRSTFPESQATGATANQDELPDPLTNRELQILELLSRRLTNKEIAAQLVIEPGTVKGHTIKIYQKLNVKSRHQAVEKAISLRILTLS